MPATNTQLLAYRFGADSKFQGELVGALERAESGGAIRVLEAVFVAREPEGELAAVALQGGTGGVTAKLLTFRLGGSDRAATTEAALAGPAGELVRGQGETLAPGEAFAAVLVQHAWAGTLADAVARLGGREAENRFVEATSLSELL